MDRPATVIFFADRVAKEVLKNARAQDSTQPTSRRPPINVFTRKKLFKASVKKSSLTLLSSSKYNSSKVSPNFDLFLKSNAKTEPDVFFGLRKQMAVLGTDNTDVCRLLLLK